MLPILNSKAFSTMCLEGLRGLVLEAEHDAHIHCKQLSITLYFRATH
jgi:hypothetical protein